MEIYRSIDNALINTVNSCVFFLCKRILFLPPAWGLVRSVQISVFYMWIKIIDASNINWGQAPPQLFLYA